MVPGAGAVDNGVRPLDVIRRIHSPHRPQIEMFKNHDTFVTCLCKPGEVSFSVSTEICSQLKNERLYGTGVLRSPFAYSLLKICRITRQPVSTPQDSIAAECGQRRIGCLWKRRIKSVLHFSQSDALKFMPRNIVGSGHNRMENLLLDVFAGRSETNEIVPR